MSMAFIDDELQEVSKLCHNVVEGSHLVSCVPSMVRTEIKKTEFKKVIVCIQFPNEYPKEILLIELKSKTLSSKLLDRLTEICEKECHNLLGKAQVLPTLKLIRNFIDAHPLTCCYDEIVSLKRIFTDSDRFVAHQETSSIRCEIRQDLYYYKFKLTIPEDYPSQCVSFKDHDSNFPTNLQSYIYGQSKEIARRCVEPPIKQGPDKNSFKSSPSLFKVVDFIFRTVKSLPSETCFKCKINGLPLDPKDLDEKKDDIHVERLYCGHIIHLKCLKEYMSTPPFHGGKNCLHCGQRVYHEKWGLCDKLAEARWAHKQARARELAEVTEFFQ